MTIDGFDPTEKAALAGYREDVAAPFFAAVARASRAFGVELEGIENLPAGRALLVANHAFGWDIAFAMEAIRARTGRPVFALGEHLWWKVPMLRRGAAAVGVVDGTPENVDRLLQGDHLVVVLPGGLREAVKPGALRYRLLWGHRYGFVRAAIRNRAPMVPLAALGADEMFEFVGDAFARGRKWLGPFGLGGIPFPVPRHFLPHRVHLRYVLGAPIAPLHGPEAAEDPGALRTARLIVEGALHELLDQELAKREHIALG